jgi:hypothetical protein
LKPAIAGFYFVNIDGVIATGQSGSPTRIHGRETG